MISKREVQNIADLSRIKISEKEMEKFQKEFSDILDYFDFLKKAKISSCKKNNFKKTNFRKDEIIEFSKIDQKKKYIKVNKIYDN